jgi:hypothetical protein
VSNRGQRSMGGKHDRSSKVAGRSRYVRVDKEPKGDETEGKQRKSSSSVGCPQCIRHAAFVRNKRTKETKQGTPTKRNKGLTTPWRERIVPRASKIDNELVP